MKEVVEMLVGIGEKCSNQNLATMPKRGNVNVTNDHCEVESSRGGSNSEDSKYNNYCTNFPELLSFSIKFATAKKNLAARAIKNAWDATL